MNKFPLNFLWGTATSAHQVEGNNVNNDWWEAEKADKLPYESGLACDHYQRFSSDFELAQKIGCNAQRLSVEWSRIEPKEGRWDQKELKHYQQVLHSIKKRRMKVVLTLHHFTNPIWFTEQGGWENKNSVQVFARFVQMVVKELGEWVDLWITINEPMVYAVQSYYQGTWPPFKKSFKKTRLVLNNMVKAHRLAYQIIHRAMDTHKEQAHVGIAQNMASFVIARKSIFNSISIKIIDSIWNFWFLAKTAGCYDFIGVNYYTRMRLKKFTIGFKKFLSWEFINPKEEGFETSDLGWEVCPTGLKRILIKLRKYHLPIYITENGIATTRDFQRSAYLISHLLAVHQAISEGCNIKGYFHWSLLDNYEWAHGFKPRFGLIGVDFKTQKRTIKSSVKIFRQIARGNKIDRQIYKLD